MCYNAGLRVRNRAQDTPNLRSEVVVLAYSGNTATHRHLHRAVRLHLNSIASSFETTIGDCDNPSKCTLQHGLELTVPVHSFLIGFVHRFMYPTCSAPRPRDAFSCTITGALLGPTEDHVFHDVHHALILATFTCFTGCEPDRQERQRPSTTLGIFGPASSRLTTTAALRLRATPIQLPIITFLRSDDSRGGHRSYSG